MSKSILIERKSFEARQTLGLLTVLEDGCPIYDCKTLELPWLDNRHDVSCIPRGCYQVEKYQSPTKGLVFLLRNVPNRAYIEMHVGNYYTDIEGCILCGQRWTDINGDGFRDVTNSEDTLDELLAMMPEEFELEIR